jgi:hypothetical protein
VSTRSDLAAVVAKYTRLGVEQVPLIALEKILAKPERSATWAVVGGAGILIGIAALVISVVGP